MNKYNLLNKIGINNNTNFIFLSYFIDFLTFSLYDRDIKNMHFL